MYIDTHAHLNYENKYGDERALMESIRAAGVDEVIAVGWDLASSRRAKAVAARYEGVYFAAGIHPSDTAKAAESDYDGVEALLSDEKAGRRGRDRAGLPLRRHGRGGAKGRVRSGRWRRLRAQLLS